MDFKVLFADLGKMLTIMDDLQTTVLLTSEGAVLKISKMSYFSMIPVKISTKNLP